MSGDPNSAPPWSLNPHGVRSWRLRPTCMVLAWLLLLLDISKKWNSQSGLDKALTITEHGAH